MNITIQKDSALILIAEDDKSTRRLLRELMEAEGYRVQEVKNGEECVAAYKSQQPDMVLLDAMMPVMDGFTCCTQLQTLLLGDRIPILMITGLNDQASVDWAFAVGATDYVTKPIQPLVLRRRVRHLLEASWAEAALRRSEKQYRSIIENVKEVIFQTDAAGLWTFLNPAWTEMTGFTVGESIGTNFSDYIHPDERQGNLELFKSLVKGNETNREIKYLTKDSGYRWVEIHIWPNLNEQGMMSGTSGILKDITKRKQAAVLESEKAKLEREVLKRQRSEETILDAWEKAKELGELKSRIITTVSHEFRTPLTTILMSTELLKNYSDKLAPEKKLDYFQRIQTTVQHLTHLVNDVLFIGEAEAGKLQLNPVVLNLTQFCRQLVEECQLTAGDKHTLTFVSQDPCVDACVDEKLLRQLFTNLLSNAVKFSTQSGNIRFVLICEQGEAIFCVQDWGIGIPLEDQARVWHPFERGSNVGNIPGTGMGLTIAKKSVDLHGGQITFDSKVGVGTTFTTVLPLECAFRC